MIFWMTSKTFRDDFLVNEKDQDILDVQYILVSTRIGTSSLEENIISVKNILFPDARVCSATDDDIFKERYYEQIEKNETFIATLIKGSIEEGYNIVFLCSKAEKKMKYLEILSDFIFIKFGYPCYEYKKYSEGISPILKYNKDKVLSKCDKLIDRAKEEKLKNNLKSKKGIKKILKSYKKLSKNELKKILKDNSIYIKGMNKKEMIDNIKVFILGGE